MGSHKGEANGKGLAMPAQVDGLSLSCPDSHDINRSPDQPPCSWCIAGQSLGREPRTHDRAFYLMESSVCTSSEGGWHPHGTVEKVRFVERRADGKHPA